MTRAGPAPSDDTLDSLSPVTRRRLEAFSRRVDRVDLDILQTFATASETREHERAVENAELVMIETGREAAVAEARRIAWAYIDRRYASAAYRPRLGTLPGPTLADAPDRARVAASFGNAITAIILEDALDPADLDELLGPWGNLVR